MKILTVLTYYRPYTSGLTIYAERLAQALVARGHEVTILTMRYDPSLPSREVIEGVSVVRADVLMRVSKGCLSPTIGMLATKLCLSHDALILHLPQFDAAGIALRGRLLKKPTILTYHCDLQLPASPLNYLAGGVVDFMNFWAGQFAHAVVAYTDDYARHSPFLRRFAHKIRVNPPPVVLPQAADEPCAQLRKLEGGPFIGMAARLAAEKGVEVLLDAFASVRERFPNAQVLFAGQYEDVLGEKEYFEKLSPRIRALEAEGAWHFLGVLPQNQMSYFYRALNVLVVPSLNSTESFGLVQIEAMMHGVPVIASDLPGVRQPVRMTGMGEVTSIGDSDSLADALTRVLAMPRSHYSQPEGAFERFSPASVAAWYEGLIRELSGQLSGENRE